MDAQEILEENQRLMDEQGLEEPDEWDEHGNPVKFKTIVNLKKKSNAHTQNAYRAMILNPPKEAVAPPPKLYDISQLKLEKFQKVLHYITNNSIKNKKEQ